MKRVIAVVFVSALTLVGCGTAPQSKSINLNPIGAVGPFNPGTLNLGAINLALSQLQQFGTLDVVGPGTNVHIARNMPPGYVWQPVVPLTSNEVNTVESDLVGSAIYGLRNDHSSLDVQVTPAVGWTIALHLAYPPSTLNPSILVTNGVVTPSTVFTNTVPATTNTVTSQVQVQPLITK